MLSPFSFQVAPAEPQTVLDALQQRLNKYREAGTHARGSGDERKARMHERIAKVGYSLPPGPALSVCSLVFESLSCLCLWSSCCLRGSPSSWGCCLHLPLSASA